MKKKSKKILFIIVSMLLILSGCSKNENKEKTLAILLCKVYIMYKLII